MLTAHSIDHQPTAAADIYYNASAALDVCRLLLATFLYFSSTTLRRQRFRPPPAYHHNCPTLLQHIFPACLPRYAQPDASHAIYISKNVQLPCLSTVGVPYHTGNLDTARSAMQTRCEEIVLHHEKRQSTDMYQSTGIKRTMDEAHRNYQINKTIYFCPVVIGRQTGK